MTVPVGLSGELIVSRRASARWGLIWSAVGKKFADAERKFRHVLTHFEQTQEAEEIINAYREIARTRRDAGAPAPLVAEARDGPRDGACAPARHSAAPGAARGVAAAVVGMGSAVSGAGAACASGGR